MGMQSVSDSAGGMTDYQAIGLPSDWMAQGTQVPGFENTAGAVSEPPSFMSHPLSWFENEVGQAYQAGKDVTKSIYGDVKNAVGTVYDDVSHPIEAAAKSTYWYLLLGIAVVAGGLYFVGKSGAIKVSI